jgi:hypothetical protein
MLVSIVLVSHEAPNDEISMHIHCARKR